MWNDANSRKVFTAALYATEVTGMSQIDQIFQVVGVLTVPRSCSRGWWVPPDASSPNQGSVRCHYLWEGTSLAVGV